MMKHVLKIGACVVLMFIGLCARAQDREGIYKHIVEIGQFTELGITDNVNVIYKCVPDSTGLAVYYGEAEFDDAFIFSVSGNALRIQVNTEDVGNPRLPVLYVYSDFLTKVVNGADFHTMVLNPAPCPNFKAVQIGNGQLTVTGIKANKVTGSLATGNGTVTLSGECVNATLKDIGVGFVNASELKATTVKCKVAGSGDISCWAIQKLTVEGIGACKVNYKGNPEIKKRGGARLNPLPAE